MHVCTLLPFQSNLTCPFLSIYKPPHPSISLYVVFEPATTSTSNTLRKLVQYIFTSTSSCRLPLCPSVHLRPSLLLTKGIPCLFVLRLHDVHVHFVLPSPFLKKGCPFSVNCMLLSHGNVLIFPPSSFRFQRILFGTVRILQLYSMIISHLFTNTKIQDHGT